MSKGFSQIRWFLRELKRRNVYKVAVTYAVVGYALMELADLVFVRLGLPEWTVTFVIVVIAIGFPLAIIITWAFELTPEGVAPTPSRDDAGSSSADAGERSGGEDGSGSGWLVVVALAGLAVLAVVAGGRYLVDDDDEAEARISDRSIAVLPFENLGGEESEQFTQGVHDGLLTRLSNISDLEVISRTSVQQYEGRELTLPEVADELGVQWVVEGAVQQAGGQVQVNAQLIDARTDAHRWAEDYRRELSPDNLFALQAEIAEAIALSLQARLSPEEQDRVERRPTDDLTAYQLYVQGRRELARRVEGDMEEAVRLFQRAIELDPEFALAWSGLADAAGHRWWGYDNYDTLEVTPGEAARRALELDPDLAEAHASMGLVHFRQREGPAALKALHRAVELRPSYAEAHNWLGVTYKILGRRDKALGHLELARELNPQHLLARHYLYDTYIAMGQVERGLKEIREQKRRYPEWRGPYIAETRALYALGRHEEARAVVQEHLQGMAWGTAYLAGIESALGNRATARDIISKLEANDSSPIVMAYAHAALGDVDATLSAFERVEDWSHVATGTLRYLTFPKGISRIRDDPRYDALLREVNQYWGLNPDGSLPDEVDVSFEAQSDQ